MERRTKAPAGRRRADLIRTQGFQLAFLGAFVFAVALGLVAYIGIGSFDDRIQAAASGECYRVQYLRWQDDRKRVQDWRLDIAAAQILKQASTPMGRQLYREELAAANQVDFLPQTNCAAAVLAPGNYRPPPGAPLRTVRPGYLRCFLATPPQPLDKPQPQCGLIYR